MKAEKNAKPKGNLMTLVAALLAVYIIWGSTYLAIKFAIETMPTFLMAGTRFLLAGGILYLTSYFTKDYIRPQRGHWRSSFILGFFLLVIGNGVVVIGEHYISSGLTALLLATVPLWMVVLGWLFAGAERPNIKVAIGLFLGLFGVGLLVAGQNGDGETASGYGQFIGTACMMIAAVSWSVGSLYGSKAVKVPSTLQAAGMQMLSGGILLFIIGTITGEWNVLDVTAISLTSWLALAFLIVFGAIVAFTAYSWLMTHTTPAIMSTHAYINPMVAVVLGWLIAGEAIGMRMLAGTAVIIASVILITFNKNSPPEAEAGDGDTHCSQMPDGKAQCTA